LPDGFVLSIDRVFGELSEALMSISRRVFLRNGVASLAALGGAAILEPGFIGRAVAAERNGARKKILVCLFQRGACDGLSMVAPVGDPHYTKLRQEIALPRPKAGDKDAAIDLDGYFALHPRLDTLLPIWNRGDLAVIHACGSPSSSRSHFDMQDFMESGVADDKSVVTGWGNRALGRRGASASPFRAVSMTSGMPRTLAGDHPAMAIRDLASFGVRGGFEPPRPPADRSGAGRSSSPAMADKDHARPAATGFEGLYDAAVGDVLGGAGRESFDAIAMLKRANPTQYKPAKDVVYPATPLGQGLLAVAQLIKADLGVEVAFVEDEGWDTHANQGGSNGTIAGKFLDLGRALSAFDRDMGDRMADIVVMTMTEFGRAVRQNGVRGTDHGHGSAFLVMGAGVKGRAVYGDWPTLSPEKLFEERDLAVTTDFRDVFGEVCVSHLGIDPRQLSSIFPKYNGRPDNFRRFMRV
jgi:uncharacterized protein (DUF1501 family)